MSFSLKVPGRANMALPGADLIDAVERNFAHIAKALRVYRRGGYVLRSVTLSRGEGKLGDRTYAELTITAAPSQDLPKPGVTDRVETFTGYIFAKPEQIPAEPHTFRIGTTATTPVSHYAAANSERCAARARKGTGEGGCDRPLDEHGYCDRPGDHLT